MARAFPLAQRKNISGSQYEPFRNADRTGAARLSGCAVETRENFEMTRMFSRLLAACTTLVATLFVLTAPASASDEVVVETTPSDVSRVEVRYDDLDLAAGPGLAQLDRRLLSAVRAVCGNTSLLDSIGWAQIRACQYRRANIVQHAPDRVRRRRTAKFRRQRCCIVSVQQSVDRRQTSHRGRGFLRHSGGRIQPGAREGNGWFRRVTSEFPRYISPNGGKA